MLCQSPLLSIVTVHLNDFSGLNFTLNSLFNIFEDERVEWIVVDGNSTPNNEQEYGIKESVELKATFWLSEPDEGIYDAMNKGMKLAKGEYVLFLNAGDRIDPDFSLNLLTEMNELSKPDMIWGQTSYEYPDGKFSVKKARSPAWAWYGMPVCHQSILFSRPFFENQVYNLDYKISADYDLLVRALKSGANVHMVVTVISEHAAGGLSQENKRKTLQEEEKVRLRHYPNLSAVNKLITLVHVAMSLLGDLSPGLNRLWRKWI